jgi:hypothetical protein
VWQDYPVETDPAPRLAQYAMHDLPRGKPLVAEAAVGLDVNLLLSEEVLHHLIERELCAGQVLCFGLRAYLRCSKAKTTLRQGARGGGEKLAGK